MRTITLFFPLLILLGWSSPANAQFTAPPLTVPEGDPRADTLTGLIVRDYPSGQPALRRLVKDGKAEGQWLEWYPDGTLRYRADWKDNMGEGTWEYFYPNGQLRSVGVYERDIPVGLHYSYHPNGQISREIPYLNGKLHGIERTYDPDGTPLTAQRFVDGKRALDRPVLFAPGVISTTTNNEYHLSFTPDGNTLYLCRRKTDGSPQKIYVSTRGDAGWSPPTVADFSTGTDEAPSVSPDGQRLYFASTRSLPGKAKSGLFDMNLWVMDRAGESWSTPRPLTGVNQTMEAGTQWPERYESNPHEGKDGNVYFWTKGKNKSGTSIYQTRRLADGKYATPRELPSPPNGPGYDLAAVISPDGNLMVFASSGRPESYGGEDLYYSFRTAEGWSKPQNFGPVVNSGRYDASPSFSPDGKYLYFASDRGPERDADGEPIWSIYYLETQYLPILRR
ncbi:PD40 domain-containing protein [Lewinella sp. W8]|uniref:PD40 domain-containing protein n=1 Tax=Lewinella sp. W8 TaxID=2528208 RepID=UPI0015661FE1|nr:PD40 domain-containing protein [Lewinella sp. W8]